MIRTLAGLLLFLPAFATAGQPKAVSLSVSPSRVVLADPDDAIQLVVTGITDSKTPFDVTSSAKIEAATAGIVRIDKGRLTPLANGSTALTVRVNDTQMSIPVTVRGLDSPKPVHFGNDVMPVLTRLGCNTGACHGKSGGQNGFALSLLGFEPASDYTAIVREGRGRRVLLSAPERSLFLVKPTGQVGHGGGKKMEIDSPEARLLVRWIGQGAPLGNPDAPKLKSIRVEPQQRILGSRSEQQLRVVATLGDGSTTDVTRRAEFVSNDEELLSVDERGLVRTLQRTGEGAVMIRYGGQVAVFRGGIPGEAPPDRLARPKPANFIDEKVFAKLDELRIPTSELCTDGEFLRRASLDIAGSLPTLEETKRFLDDAAPNKRVKLVDTLLSRSGYASYFALKWGDILRVRGGTRNAKKGKGKSKKPKLDTPAQRADAFHAWLLESFSKNKPYDRFVRELLTTQGDSSGPKAPPTILWHLEMKTAERMVDDTAQAFLGTRIQCAQCHHHPFERWSQDDYWGLASFFAKARWQKPGKGGELAFVRLSEAGRIGQSLSHDPKAKLTDRLGNEYEIPQALDSTPMKLAEGADPREKLVDWMSQPDNPFFARALVNRYWAHFFGRGMVEPIDDLRVTNPPSNEGLLDALAKDFVDHRFDLKHLIRTICTSKTYQLSSTPNEWNKDDHRCFSRFYVRQLGAEVLHDAVDRVLHDPTKFRAMGGEYFPEGTRAIDLPDAYVSSYFLTVFGKPKRESACECERESRPTLAQRLHLLNGLQRKILKRAADVTKDKRPDKAKLEELYLEFFSRPPKPRERERLLGYLEKKRASKERDANPYFDVLWALLNTKEMILQH